MRGQAAELLQYDRPCYNVFWLMPQKQTRLLIAGLIGLSTGVFCWYLMVRLHQGAGDFIWAIRAAQDLLARRNPYRSPYQLYPLPAALFGLPLTWLKPELAGGIFYGVSSALLAFGISRFGYERLLIFLAYPYWAGMITVQWIPIIMASAFFCALTPAILAKPQIGLPVLATHLNRKNVVIAIATLLLSLIVMPHWISLWLGNLGGYSRFIPLLVLPGPLLALALLRYKDWDSWLLFLAACMPQRWFYDPFSLWLIPKTRREIIYTAGLSWIPGIWRWYHPPHNFIEAGRWMVLWMYLPMLVVLFLRKTKPTQQAVQELQERTGSGANSGASEPVAKE
jgi:hypothetical protein